LQNSIIFTPFAPNAGPTGGDGLAAPPLICSLINALICFAIVFSFFGQRSIARLARWSRVKGFSTFLPFTFYLSPFIFL
jgi:hypothetical protein